MFTRNPPTIYNLAACNRPLAAPGYTSYRHPNAYGGWIMIGAKDHEDAMREAARSTTQVDREKLEVYVDGKYQKVSW